MVGIFSLKSIAMDKYFKRKENSMKKFQIILGTMLLLSIGLVISSPAKAIEMEVGGGLWDFGVEYNWLWQSRQYSDFWHPNWHRSTAMQDNVNAYSPGIRLTGQGTHRWTAHNSWAKARTSYSSNGYYHRSYYSYLNY